MNRRNRIITGVTLGVACAVLLFAHAAGPDPWHTGAPGDLDNLACTTSGCHVGLPTPLNPAGGNVVVNFPNGLTYTPGVQQTFTIVITDAAAKIYGFQMTARLESNLAAGQAGDFTAAPCQTGNCEIVICSDKAGPAAKALFKMKTGCPANAPIEFIEHYLNPLTTNTISVSWTPPATNVGNVHIYVAANASPGQIGVGNTNTHDHIYTANYTLCPATTAPPTITTVQSAGAFNPNAGLASGTWLEIYGSNFSCTTRGWAGSDFQGSNAPTSLDKVGVTIDGIPAYVDYVSPGQVNVQAPDDSHTGAGIQVVLTNSAGPSNGVSMQENSIAPAVLAPPSFIVNGKQWVVAQFPDQTFVGPVGLIPGLNFRPAKVGETIIIYGIGFGPVSPATPAGTIAGVANSLTPQPNFRFGQALAKLAYAGLAPGFVGLYQFNVVVPNVGAADMPLNVDIGGVTLKQNTFISVGQ
jgi:uncharacterized protein (TIGR03437 family)